MHINVICVGKLKETFYREAQSEFLKRLSRFADASVTEVADERAPEQLSDAAREQVKAAEGSRVLARIQPGDFVVATDLKGVELTSEALAQHMGDWMNRGKSRLTFVIGGSLGLSREVLARADYRLCLGKPTFSHQIFRVMLLEQIYRGFKILNNEPYHK